MIKKMRSVGSPLFLLVSAVMLALLAPVSLAAATVDEKSQAVLDKLSAFYRAKESLQLEITTSTKMSMPGRKEEQAVKTRVLMKRPNFLKTEILEGDGANIISDGKTISILIPQAEAYLEKSAAASFEQMLDDQELLIVSGLMLFTPFLRDNPAEALLAGAESAAYVAQEDLDGKKADRIRLTREEGALDVWVAAEGDPVVWRIQPDMSKMIADMAASNPEAANMEVELIETYTGHDWAPAITDSTFTFTPPAGSRKAKTLMEALTGQKSAESMVGEKSPEVKLALASGGELDIASHVGSKVVVLDFWATWCPPCRKGLPTISKVAAEYADKGVVIYAVNLREDKATIDEFLAAQKLALQVPMDVEGKVAESFGVMSIPTTVVIGKDGIVKSVHVGLSEDLESDLKKDLAELVPAEAASNPAP